MTGDEYFNKEHFDLLKEWKEKEKTTETQTVYDKLKKAYEITINWANKLKDACFNDGEVDARARPTNQANRFLGYNWAKIYPKKNSPKGLAYTVGIDAKLGFVVKIDLIDAKNGDQKDTLRKEYKKLNYDKWDDTTKSPICAVMSSDEGLNMNMHQLVEWSTKAVNNFKPNYGDVACELGISENIEKKENNAHGKFPLNRILYGPPGTGKTFITAKKAVEICLNKKFPEVINAEEEIETEIREKYNELSENQISAGKYTAKQITFTTFHQSMGYEDFVEGLRPETLTNGSGFTLEPKAGIFKKVCEVAKDNPNTNFVIIIDEINRGNVSKIFGELITLLEEDKRKDNDYAISVTLPYSQDEFSVPKNVYIIGTMNTADRSIAPIDTALRRRFEFTEMMPEYNLDDMGHLKDDNNIHKGKLLEAINHKIIEKYDRDHQIGHAYLINIDSKSKLDEVFRNKIIPLLQEYFYDNLQTIHDILGDGFIKIKDGKNYQVKDEFDYKKLLEMDNAGVNQSETEHNNDE